MYKKSILEIQLRRERELSKAKEKFEDALRRNPELLSVEKELRESVLKDAKDEKTASLKTQKLNKSRDEILLKMGITKKELEPPFKCKSCFDTGIFNKSVCDCAKVLALNSTVNIGIPLYNFKDFNPSLFEEEVRKHTIKIFANVQKIVSAFPNDTRRIITVLGPTGTGKTFLAGCVANEFLHKNYSVTAITAFDFVNRALSYHTTFDEDKMYYLSPLLDSDLLIIDDLGTEPILKNVSLEYLFLVLNERMRNDCLTFINSNLDAASLKARYGERIYSRISDQNIAYPTLLKGNDIRRLEKR
ncbi:MAG: ATP-binding protein [Firmicutes bacterium]|nr:ATP-binding protein [Bacillota bacterium]